ncbi:membrane protein [Smithella sp. SC_K08D17]|nr:membrane protein [Smithella sp. D17]KIE17399.1 membrane protein [Smithella sp. SC_K08D17]
MGCKPNPEDIAGGQAIIEGVMMRHGNKIAAAVRRPDKEIVFQEREYIPLTKRYKPLGWMFVRGTITLFEMMIIGIQFLMFSANVALEEEKKKPRGWEMYVSLVLSFAVAIFFFVVVPAFFFTKIKVYVGSLVVLNILEGCVRLGIFLAFLSVTLLMKDMRRVYMYHGSEHKTVFAWEDGQELTVENVKKYSTRHPRCGTSFILFVMIISVLIFSLLGRPDFLHRVIYKILLLPVVAGISYEIIRFTGKYSRFKLVQVLSWPGLALQRITTREPDDDQIEVAIAAMKKVV